MALSQRLAQQLKGNVTLQSSVLGKGSIFCLKIPCVEVCDLELGEILYNRTFNSPVQLCLPIETELQDKKILVVDDCEDNQKIFKHILKSVGGLVDVAENGRIAIHKMENNSYDFVLMDIQMPVMDGLAATKIIRKMKYRKPIIALTAHASNESKTNCMKSGFTDLIAKPVTRLDLINNILFILNQNTKYITRRILP